MAFLKRLSDIAPTQVLAKGIKLNDVLEDKFLNEIKKQFKSQYEDIVCSNITFMLIPKVAEPQLEKIKNEKNIKIQLPLPEIDFLKLEHPTSAHYSEGVAVITTNRKGNLNKVIKI